jgi:uridine kinase
MLSHAPPAYALGRREAPVAPLSEEEGAALKRAIDERFAAGRPIIMSVVGPRGSGKSTLTDPIKEYLESLYPDAKPGDPPVVTVVRADSYFIHNRDERAFARENRGYISKRTKQLVYSASKKEGTNFEWLAADLERLARYEDGEERELYDTVEGVHKPERQKRARVIIVDGQHTHTDERIERLIDTSVYLDMDPKTNLARTAIRDHKKGVTWLDTAKRYRSQQDYSREVIVPQKERAHIYVRFGARNWRERLNLRRPFAGALQSQVSIQGQEAIPVSRHDRPHPLLLRHMAQTLTGTRQR